MWPKALLPLEENRSTDLIALKNPLFSAGFEPVSLGFNYKHNNR
jgi:hypothetical protein